MVDGGGPQQPYREPREAEKDGTQAIADALAISDKHLFFGGLQITTDPNAPPGSIFFINATDIHTFDGTSWSKR